MLSPMCCKFRCLLKNLTTRSAISPLLFFHCIIFTVGHSCNALISGLVYVLHAELYLGNTSVIVPAFDFPSLLSYIQRYRMTKLFLVPPVVIRLAKDTLTDNYDLSSLEEITCGAAPLGNETMGLLRSKFKDIIFKQGCLVIIRLIFQRTA